MKSILTCCWRPSETNFMAIDGFSTPMAASSTVPIIACASLFLYRNIAQKVSRTDKIKNGLKMRMKIRVPFHDGGYYNASRERKNPNRRPLSRSEARKHNIRQHAYLKQYQQHKPPVGQKWRWILPWRAGECSIGTHRIFVIAAIDWNGRGKTNRINCFFG